MNTWYRESFGIDYLTLYKHRDFQGAYDEVKRMMEWLQLPQGAEVLDLCCGMGRHSLALADFGFKVIGVDLSDVLLEEARKHDGDSRVTWIKGDMRDVPLQHSFDAVVNLFTSFGYFSEDQENARVLGEISRLLKPEGKFIIDFLNPKYVKAHLVPQSERQEGTERIVERRSIEEGFVRKRIVMDGEGVPERHYLEQVKLYSREQFVDMLRDAGLSVDHVYGGYDGEAYDPFLTARMIMVGHKSSDREWS